jgi:hypothetical protein
MKSTGNLLLAAAAFGRDTESSDPNDYQNHSHYREDNQQHINPLFKVNTNNRVRALGNPQCKKLRASIPGRRAEIFALKVCD